MTWKIAQAKQNFSRVIREAAEEPQLIHKRDRPVAAVIAGETFALFETWLRERARHRPLSEAFAELRALCAEQDYEFPEVLREARVHGFPLATRNVKDFEGCGIEIVNPFQSA